MNRKLVITAIIIALILIAGFYVNKARDSSSTSTNSENQDTINSEISNSISDLDSSGNIDLELGLDQDFDYNLQ